MPGLTLERRTFLRGAGGVALALPPLEIMGSRRARAADTTPKRFVLSYCGNSMPGGNNVVPAETGPAYTLTRALQPLGDSTYGINGLKNDMGLVTGLQIPWATNPADHDNEVAGSVPPAGRLTGFHGTTTMPQVCGCKGYRGDIPVRGATSVDQIVAETLRGNSIYASLTFRVPPTDYYGGGGGGGDGRISVGARGLIDPISSLRVAYSTVFGGTAPLAGGGWPVSISSIFDRRKSILDVVNANAKRLLPRLGGEDRARMDKHFQYIAELEKSIDALRTKVDSGPACKRPSEPADPPIGGDTSDANDMSKPENFSGDLGWSNEELRAQIMGDFVYIALACDLTRSLSWHLSMRQGSWNVFNITGQRISSHGASHSGADDGGASDQAREGLADLLAWHIKHLGRLVGRLRDTREVDGTSVLDSAALCMLFEGGIGFDPEGNTSKSSHSTENMVAVVAGRAGGLKTGQHIRYQNNRHPGQVVLTLMKAVGVSSPLGDITQPLPELFSPQGI